MSRVRIPSLAPVSHHFFEQQLCSFISIKLLARLGTEGHLTMIRLVLALCVMMRIIAADAGSYQTNVVEGWRVLIDARLLAGNRADTEKVLKLLRGQLHEISEKVPASAVEKLRQVTLWFSPRYTGVAPKAEYHPGAEWLREHGRNPEMVKGVEFTNIPEFEAETRRMPNFTLHELAHAFHDRFL